MGCSGSSASTETIPIERSIIHLLQSGNNELVLKKLKTDKRIIDPNAKCNFRGDTLLHYAANKDCVELVKYLLEHKADPNIRNA